MVPFDIGSPAESPGDQFRKQLMEMLIGGPPSAPPPEPTRGAKAKEALGTFLAGLSDAMASRAGVLGRYNPGANALQQLMARREYRRREEESKRQGEVDRHETGKREAAKQLLTLQRDEEKWANRLNELETRQAGREARDEAEREFKAAQEAADRAERAQRAEEDRMLRKEIESMRGEMRSREEAGRNKRAETAAAAKPQRYSDEEKAIRKDKAEQEKRLRGAQIVVTQLKDSVRSGKEKRSVADIRSWFEDQVEANLLSPEAAAQALSFFDKEMADAAPKKKP